MGAMAPSLTVTPTLGEQPTLVSTSFSLTVALRAITFLTATATSTASTSVGTSIVTTTTTTTGHRHAVTVNR